MLPPLDARLRVPHSSCRYAMRVCAAVQVMICSRLYVKVEAARQMFPPALMLSVTARVAARHAIIYLQATMILSSQSPRCLLSLAWLQVVGLSAAVQRCAQVAVLLLRALTAMLCFRAIRDAFFTFFHFHRHCRHY